MKIKKTLFSTEIDLQINEFNQLLGLPRPILSGLTQWTKKHFGLNLFVNKK